MKKLFTLLLCAAMTMSVMGAVTPFDYNGLHFQTNDAEDAATLLKSDDYKTFTEVVVPDSAYWAAGSKMLPVKYMEDKCFENCTLIEKATSGKALDRPYGDYFKGCTALKHMVIRHTNGSSAWVQDETLEQLETLEFAPVVTAVASNYIYYGKNLKVLKLYNTNVCNWNWNLSYACKDLANLERVEINDDSNSLLIDHGAVYSKDEDKKLYLLPRKSGVTSLAVLDGCTQITQEAFIYNTDLKSVTIPSSVRNIYQNAFDGCTALTSIDLSQCALTIVRAYCFQNCTSLATITLSDKITEIYEDAFANTAYVNNDANWNGGFLYLGDILLQTKPDALSGDIAIKDGTRVLATYSLKGLKDVTGVTLPASVKYIGSGAFQGCSKLTSLDLSHVLYFNDNACKTCSKLETVIFGSVIERIDNYAFNGCDKLTTVYIPKGTVPGSSGCPYYGLSQSFTVHIPVGTKPFYSASEYYSTCAENMTLEDDLLVPGAHYTVAGLQYTVLSVDDKTAAVTWETRKYGTAAYASLSGDITVPEKVTLGTEEYTVTEIDAYSFYYCDDVTSLSLPKSIRKIGEYACYGSDNLATVTVASGGVMTEVGASAFETNSNLTSVTLPSTVEIIGDKAFKLCGLTTFPMPTSLKKVGEEAFYCCYKLPDFVLSEGIEEIGNRAFYFANLVTRAYLPSTVKSLGAETFHGGNYTKWEVHPDNKYFRADEDGVLYNKDKTVLIGTFENNNISTFVIPETVTSMYKAAFAYNDNLKSVVFPAGLKDIPKEAFSDCDGLRKLDLRHVQTIGDQAFNRCEMVDTILLGADLRSIGDQGLAYIWSSSYAGTASRPAFYFMCEAVDVPDIQHTALLSLGSYAPASAKKILVPLESVEQYRNTYYWKDITGMKGYTYWTITANKPDGGTVTGGEGMIIEGETITLTATPKRGYKFAKWSDGEESATRDITVAAEHANLVLEAQFDEVPVDVGGTFQDVTTEGVLVTYKVLTKADGDKTVQVGNGTTPAINTATAGTVTIPAQVSYLSDVYDVVSMGDRAISQCNNLTTLHLPNSILRLGNNSVYECANLAEVNIPNQLQATGKYNFAYLPKLVSITIPSSVKHLGYATFDFNNIMAEIVGWNPSNFDRVGTLNWYYLSPIVSDETYIQKKDGFRYMGDVLTQLPNSTTIIVPEGARIISGKPDGPACKSIEYPSTVEAFASGALFGLTQLETCTIKALTPPLIYCTYDVEIEQKANALRAYSGGCDDTYYGSTPTPEDVKYYVPKAALAAYQASDKWNMLDLRPVEGWTVTFKDERTGLDIAVKYADTYASVEAPDAPEHTGYKFIGWDSNAYMNVTGDLVITATYVSDPTGIDQTPFPAGEGRGEALKIIRDNQLLILRDGKTYNVMGVEVR